MHPYPNIFAKVQDVAWTSAENFSVVRIKHKFQFIHPRSECFFLTTHNLFSTAPEKRIDTSTLRIFSTPPK